MAIATRRQIVFSTVALAGTYGAGLFSRDMVRFLTPDPIKEAQHSVLPNEVRTGVFFRDSVARLVGAGAIVPKKLAALYRSRGGVPEWMADVLSGQRDHEIVLSLDTASDLLKLLWPLGLATQTGFGRGAMPVTNEKLPRLASTGGWRLGEIENGAAYFSAVETLTLTEPQEVMVSGLAKKIYRPCCDNSALFQDCNHGSAMLGFLELGVSQNVAEKKLFELAKALNGYWYPEEYIAMALLFEQRDGIAWKSMPATEVLGRAYSSLSGWRTNVARPLAKSDIIPRQSERLPSPRGCAL